MCCFLCHLRQLVHVYANVLWTSPDLSNSLQGGFIYLIYSELDVSGMEVVLWAETFPYKEKIWPQWGFCWRITQMDSQATCLWGHVHHWSQPPTFLSRSYWKFCATQYRCIFLFVLFENKMIKKISILISWCCFLMTNNFSFFFFFTSFTSSSIIFYVLSFHGPCALMVRISFLYESKIYSHFAVLL